MSTATKPTAFERMADVHQHHAERIEHAAEAMLPGTVVVLDESADGGTFFTGIRGGDRVIVRDRNGSTGSAYVARVDNVGARLCAYEGTFTSVPVREWTLEEVNAAAQAATDHAASLLERAYASANHLTGAPAGDEHALAALRTAQEYRFLAHALKAWASQAQPGMIWL